MSQKTLWSLVVAMLALGVLLASAGAQDETRKRLRARTTLAGAQAQPDEVTGAKATLSAGQIPLHDFFRFLKHQTSKTLVYPSATDDPYFRPDVQLDVLDDVTPLTEEIVRSMLRANGYVLFEETLADGAQVLHVRHYASRQNAPLPPLTPVIGAGEEIPSEPAHRLVTVVLKLEHLAPSAAISVLRDLLNVQGSRSHVGELNLIAVESQSAILVKGQQHVARYIRDVVKALDFPAKPRAEGEARSK